MRSPGGIRLRRLTAAAALAAAILLCAQLCTAQDEAPAPAPPPEAAPAPQQVPEMTSKPSTALLDTGFDNLYQLNFQSAREQFIAYQNLAPDDPMGKAAEAASYLFEQFNAKGVFTSAFFVDDSKFLKGVEGSPEENRNEKFEVANDEARERARKILKSDMQNPNAMLVLTMTDGMESDYDALIEKKQIAAVSLTKQAEAEATALLAIDPNAQDAYVALGAGHYIIGCLPGYKRAFLWFGGIHGDKELGMHQEEIAAYHAHYFKPFAKILLALAYEREHQPAKARVLLTELKDAFPTNPHFARELALIDNRECCAR